MSSKISSYEKIRKIRKNLEEQGITSEKYKQLMEAVNKNPKNLQTNAIEKEIKTNKFSSPVSEIEKNKLTVLQIYKSVMEKVGPLYDLMMLLSAKFNIPYPVIRLEDDLSERIEKTIGESEGCTIENLEFKDRVLYLAYLLNKLILDKWAFILLNCNIVYMHIGELTDAVFDPSMFHDILQNYCVKETGEEDGKTALYNPFGEYVNVIRINNIIYHFNYYDRSTDAFKAHIENYGATSQEKLISCIRFTDVLLDENYKPFKSYEELRFLLKIVKKYFSTRSLEDECELLIPLETKDYRAKIGDKVGNKIDYSCFDHCNEIIAKTQRDSENNF